MRRGTTPTHIFKVPIDLTEAAEVYIRQQRKLGDYGGVTNG